MPATPKPFLVDKLPDAAIVMSAGAEAGSLDKKEAAVPPMTFETLLADQSPDAAIVMTSSGTIVHWSRGAERIFGYSAIESLGRTIFDLTVIPQRRTEELRFISETLKTGGATFESLCRRKDGSLVNVDVSSKLIQDQSQNSSLILMTKKDVTHLRAQRDSKLMEARFRDLLESTPDGIVMVNPTGHIVFLNSHAERLFGYDRSEMLHRKIELLLPEWYQLSSDHLVRPMGAGLELRGLRRDGTEFSGEITLSALETGEGTLTSSAIRDITERKRFETALQEKNLELAEANQAKDRFLASMSHELRTPLNSIIGYTGTLLMKLPGPLNSDQEKQLRVVQTSSKHLLALINDLLDMAKIEAGKMEPTLESVDCRSVVEQAAALLRPQAEAKALLFKVSMPEDALRLLTDRRALSQIVINLTANAIKFTDHGEVHVQARRSCTDEKKTLEISVADTGIGIPLEDQSRLFSAFARANVAEQRFYEGTGLGLHLSQRLAGVLGGRIVFHSEPGVGSTFTLVLPEA